MNRLHPIFQGYTYQAGSRIDTEETLPPSLKDEDLELLLDDFSEPPTFIERIAPLTVQVGTDMVKGKNYTELALKSYRILAQIFKNINIYVRQSIIDNFKEKGMVPLINLGIDPTTLTQIIEMDYETGDNVYSQLMNHFTSGIISPSVTVPFHTLLPLVENDFDIELLIKIGFKYYWHILTEHHKFLKKVHNETKFVVCFWLPDGGYSKKIVKTIYDEFLRITAKDKISDHHLVFILDSQQIEERENDMIMKSWNFLQIGENKNDVVSVLFKDRNFSDWVINSNPSVKKLLDRTIAKVDSDLNELSTNYCWSHYEEIENILKTHKSAKNFEQKIIKLIELAYMPTSPDFFVRRKLNKKFGRSPYEPVKVDLKDNTAWSDWHVNNISLGRWTGNLDSNAEYKLVDENKPYSRYTETGKVEEIGPQCWKIAYNESIKKCADAVKGNYSTLKGGIIELLAGMVPSKDPKIIKNNVREFLVEYSLIYWREHFLQSGYNESDIFLPELVYSTLYKQTKAKSPKDEECIIAATAAQAYYFALEGLNSIAVSYENLDQRAVYQNVMYITLSMTRAITVYHWTGKTDKAKKLVEILKEELINFSEAYGRYNLAEYGVTKDEWKSAIKSVVSDSNINIVSRASRRIAARHLRQLGYRKDFSIDDENITTNTGHLWNQEIENPNFRWENKLFYGIKEE